MSSGNGNVARTQQGSSFDQLLTDLMQVVAEILMIRRPRVQTASVMAEPPPDIILGLTQDTCPFCPGGVNKHTARLVR